MLLRFSKSSTLALTAVVFAAQPAFSDVELSEATLARISECGGGFIASNEGLRLRIVNEMRLLGLGFRQSESLRAAFLEDLNLNGAHGSEVFRTYTQCVTARDQHDVLLSDAIATSDLIETQLLSNDVPQDVIDAIMHIREEQVEALEALRFVEAARLKSDLTKAFVESLDTVNADFGEIDFTFGMDDVETYDVNLMAPEQETTISAQESEFSLRNRSEVLLQNRLEICGRVFEPAWCEEVVKPVIFTSATAITDSYGILNLSTPDTDVLAVQCQFGNDAACATLP